MSESAASVTERPTRVRWLVFVLACATSWLLYLHRYAWGVIKPDIKAEFDLTDVQVGWIDSAFMAPYALFQIPTGLLGDLFGPALVLPIIIFGWSGLVAVPFAATGFWPLIGMRASFGMAQAGAYPNLHKITRSWFPRSVRTTVQGLIASTAGRSGGACSSLVVSALLLGYLGVGWRSALLILAGLGVVFAVVFRLLFRDTPARHPWVNAAERRLIEADEPVASPETRVSFTRDRAARRSFAVLLVRQFGSAFADALYVFWIPLFLQEAKGLGRIELGLYASLPLWGGAIGGMFGGVLNDLLIRVVGRRWARTMVGLTGKVVAAGLVVMSIGLDDGRSVMMVLAVAKFFTDWSQPTMWGTVTDIAGRAAGSVFGTVNMVGSIGMFSAGLILGPIKQGLGWNALFWTIAGVYFASGVCWLMIDPTRPLVVEVEGPTGSQAAPSG